MSLCILPQSCTGSDFMSVYVTYFKYAYTLNLTVVSLKLYIVQPACVFNVVSMYVGKKGWNIGRVTHVHFLGRTLGLFQKVDLLPADGKNHRIMSQALFFRTKRTSGIRAGDASKASFVTAQTKLQCYSVIVGVHMLSFGVSN